MWIYFADANVSISQHKDAPGSLMVRARDRESLERLFPGATLIETPEADYRWRVTLPRARVVAAVVERLQRLDYTDDVKNLVDHTRRDLYRDLWAVTRGYFWSA